MTPAEIQELLRRSVGKRARLESNQAILTGTIHGVSDDGLLLVTGLREETKPGRKPTGFVPKDGMDRWGLPRRKITPLYLEGEIVFRWKLPWNCFELTVEL